MDNKSLLPRILLYLSHLHLFHRELSFFHQLTLMQLEIVLFEIHLPSSTCYEQHLISNKSLLQRKLRTFHHSLKSFNFITSNVHDLSNIHTCVYRILPNRFQQILPFRKHRREIFRFPLARHFVRKC